MLMLPIPWRGKLKLLIVLEDDNLQRIKEHDCAEVIWAQLAQYASLPPDTISIGYANPEEMKQIYAWAEKGDVEKAVRLVTGGFKYRPEAGDHDAGPVSIIRNTGKN